KVVQQADITVADGIGIIQASKWMGQPLKERIAGVEVVDDLLHLANEKGYSCYFLGAEKKVNKRAVKRIKKDFTNLRIAGKHHGFFDHTKAKRAKKIASTSPYIIFVALGAPKQEMWIS